MKYLAILACALLPALLGCDVNVTVKSDDQGSSFELRTSDAENSPDDTDKTAVTP